MEMNRRPHAISGEQNGLRADPARQQELLSLTRELGTELSVRPFRRSECCDGYFASGAFGWVLAGIVRKTHIFENGQRRIVDVMMAGDFFGLDPDDASTFSFDAAADGTVVAKITSQKLEALAASRPSLCLFMVESACRTISRLERHILVQGCTTSTKKVRGYLQSMARRLPRDRTPVKLPLSRYDIADHVGIAVETVSRAITELQRRGVIELEGPRGLSMRCSYELAKGLPGEP